MALPGVNTEEGLQRVGGSKAFYFKILSKFRDSQSQAVAAIRASVQTGDMDEATRAAHTLRGVAGNIGATALSAAAQTAEAALKAGDTANLEELLHSITVELEPLLHAIDALSDSSPEAQSPPTHAPVDWAQLEPHLQQLQALLEDSDTEASECLEAIAPLLTGTPHAESLRAIETRLAKYDFDGALEKLSLLKQALQDPVFKCDASECAEAPRYGGARATFTGVGEPSP